MFKDKDIVCISPISWDFLWQRHQIFMKMFAKKGHRVFYLENLNPSPIIDSSVFSKIAKRYNRIFLKPFRKEENKIPNLQVITPFIIPFKNKIARMVNEAMLIKFLAFYLKTKIRKNPVIWTYLATSSVLKLIDTLKPQFLIYDCVFDACLHPDSPKDIEITEKKIIKSSDVVFADNQHLFKKCKGINSNTHIIPPGVDFEHFAFSDANEDPALFHSIKHPRICFFGGIDEIRLDLQLIEYIAREKPDWNILLFGPVIKTDTASLKLKNIFLNAAVSHEVLPRYLKKMDVLILPYKIIAFTRSILPAKIFECLATGKPIVSTPLEELSFFEKGLIKIAKAKEAFLMFIEEGLTSDDVEGKKKRLKIASENSWAERFKEIQRILNQMVSEKTEAL